MPLFSIKGNKLEKINKEDFKLEREIQQLVEENLNDVLGLEFVRTEFQLGNLRIDSLAFDPEAKSFVIIEYKRGKNFSVIDQGYAYLSLLLNNKADFILEYNENKEDSLGRMDVDWSQSRVVFVSPKFTKYQRQAIEFKDLPIELWEITKYKGDILLLNQLIALETSESITTVSSESDVVKQVSKEVVVNTEERQIKRAKVEFQDLYDQIRTRILDMDNNIEIKPFTVTIAFKSDNYFLHVAFQKTQLKLWLNLLKGELKDPREMAKDVSNVGHWGAGDYELSLKPDDDLDYVMTLIKQAYMKNL